MVLQIFGDRRSGNCLKVVYTCDRLAVPYAFREVDVVGGEARSLGVRALNPAGQVPFVVLDDGRTLAQSNAIMAYLAEGSPLLPTDRFLRAKVFEHLFWEQYSHEPYIAVCRYQLVYLHKALEEREPWRVERGEFALDHMERHLADRAWFVGDDLTIADIGLFAYTRFAEEGGFSLAGRPRLGDWVRRCAAILDPPRTSGTP